MAIDPESRFVELEIQLGHCQHSIEELNRTVFRQQQQIDLLQAQLREIFRQIQSDAAAGDQLSRHERPPHY